MTFERYDEAERLDSRLGDAWATDNPFGFAAALERDDREAFPEDLLGTLRDEGFHLNYLPKALGGRLDGFDRTLALVRVAARRDLNVMPATMFSISAVMSVLVHGSDEQKQRVAEIVRTGGSVGFALSEEETGSDVLNNTCRLDEKNGAGFLVTGEKWLVGLGARCDALYLVGRTGERGPGAFSSVLVERDALPGDRVEVGPIVRTTGMRGIDFACFRFDRCPVPADALVGTRGQGLEGAMKAQQVVRMMSAAGNLACADTALRVVLDFALERVVQRARVIDLPHARRELAAAAAALMVCDVTALAAARAVHVAPETFSLWSSVVKRVVTELSEELIARCGGVLGARSVLRDGRTAIFQKMQRDNAIVRVIDTSPVGNLRTVAMQLPLLASRRDAGAPEDVGERLEQIFALDRALPEFAPEKLDLTGRASDPVSQGLAAIAREAGEGSGGATRIAEVDSAFAALYSQVEELKGAKGAAFAASAELLDLADRFCCLHAAAACVHLWWFNRGQPLFGEEPESLRWLDACLALLLARAAGRDAREAAAETEAALEIALRLHEEGRLFSAIPLQLADGSRA